jgi:hypothetical protein
LAQKVQRGSGGRDATNIAMEAMAHRNRWVTGLPFLKIVIFYSYVKLPEGTWEHCGCLITRARD